MTATILTFLKTPAGKYALMAAAFIAFLLFIRQDAVSDFANEVRAKAYREYEEHGRVVDQIVKEVEDADKETLRELLRQFGSPSGL